MIMYPKVAHALDNFRNAADLAVVLRQGEGLLDELGVLATYTPGVDEADYPTVAIRPLHGLSNLVVDVLPTLYDRVMTGDVPPMELLERIEAEAWRLDSGVVPELLTRPQSVEVQVAVLDIAWAERCVNVAYGEQQQGYRIRRNASRFFTIGRILAEASDRYPLLQWRDIADGYPSNDPRRFLSPGLGQEQEQHLYRVQSAVERSLRHVVRRWIGGVPGDAVQHEILALWRGVGNAMGNVSRKRAKGEFEKLDRFLSPNGEVHGHATGSFSVWTKLAGYLCTGREGFLGSVVVPDNMAVFPAEARMWIDEIVAGRVQPLVPTDTVLAAEIERACTRFSLIHLGACKRHARSTLDRPAPARQWMSNLDSIRRTIDE